MISELSEQPSASELRDYSHALVRAIAGLEAAGQTWLRERLVDLLYFQRRRWCWEVPFVMPPRTVAEGALLRALPAPSSDEPINIDGGFVWPRIEELRSGNRRVRCPRCPTIIMVAAGLRIPDRCDFCQAPLTPGAFRVLPLSSWGAWDAV